MDQCTGCERPRNEVKKLIELKKGTYICNKCVASAQAQMPDKAAEGQGNKEVKPLKKPKEIKAYLDSYVISQDYAKTAMAVAVYNHYKRREAILRGVRFEDEGVEIQKSNILLMGPTGTGKTQIARTLARMLGVPFYVGDATSLTMQGYVGDSVDSLLQGLLADCGGDVDQAKWGIVFLDEADKLARKSGRSVSGYRDITGEGVQQSLLKMVEGSVVSVERPGRNGADVVDTSNILFILSGSFAGIADIVKGRLNKSARLGFGAISRQEVSETDIFQKIEEADILEFGIIPELLGRIPVHTSTLPLTEEEMVRVLTEPRDAIIRQFRALFALDGIDLQFDHEALCAIGREAKSRPTGARALRSIVEKVLQTYAYDCPSDPSITALQISQDVVEKGAPARIVRKPQEKVAATA